MAMIDGYKMAADCLVDDADDSERKRNRLIYPIVFCYRHFLELSLKHVIADIPQVKRRSSIVSVICRPNKPLGHDARPECDLLSRWLV